MGSKTRRASNRSAKSTQYSRFPVGELARRKRELRESYLSKSKELNALRKKNSRIKEKVCMCISIFTMEGFLPALLLGISNGPIPIACSVVIVVF